MTTFCFGVFMVNYSMRGTDQRNACYGLPPGWGHCVGALHQEDVPVEHDRLPLLPPLCLRLHQPGPVPRLSLLEKGSYLICAVGYNAFNRLILPGQVAKFNSKTHYKKVIPFFSSGFVRVCIQICKQCCKYGYKNIAEFDVGFESVDKVAKKLMLKRLSMKKWQKNGVIGVFDFYWVQNFFVRIFLHFFLRIRTQHQILRLMLPI